jgi:hypothetical protein
MKQGDDRMKVNVALWGGSSYVHPDESTVYPSLKDALNDWSDMQTFQRTRDGLGAPCWGDVDIDAGQGYTYVGYAWMHDGSDDDPIGAYPDYVLRLGIRGGLRWESA